MDEIKVLQLGALDWSKKYALPEGIIWSFLERPEIDSKTLYDIVFLDRNLTDEEIDWMSHVTKAYTLFVTEQVTKTEKMEELMARCKGSWLNSTDISAFLKEELKYYFPKPYGEKYDPNKIAIAQGFRGSVKWNGSCNVTLNGDYGESFEQVVFWRNNIPVFKDQRIDFWLEYKKDPGVEIALRIIQFVQGSVSSIQKIWNFSEEEMQQVVSIENTNADGPIFVSLLAKGSGELSVIALHDRYSRKNHGFFLPGGERYVDSEREELFCYFDPGDRKPPLTVYFSGYKTMEGFEGYRLMKRMGCPFLLVAEARLEGGAFYVGSPEYEKMVTDAIKKYMDELHFTPEDVIFAGLSMGTFGALYYGCELEPHALLLGKPLASIGSVAQNERLFRPGTFPTSLDVLMNVCGNTNEESVNALNEKFWNRFDKAGWSKTKFIVSYMLEDDYDSKAYEMLLSHLNADGVQVYGKGIHGRHNDNTDAIVKWFVNQLERMLKEDFERGREE